MERFRIGNPVITEITKLALDNVNPAFLYPGAAVRARYRKARSTPQHRPCGRALTPGWCRSLDRTVLIDTATGNDKDGLTILMLDDSHQPYLERLAAAGVAPEAVDVVL